MRDNPGRASDRMPADDTAEGYVRRHKRQKTSLHGIPADASEKLGSPADGRQNATQDGLQSLATAAEVANTGQKRKVHATQSEDVDAPSRAGSHATPGAPSASDTASIPKADSQGSTRHAPNIDSEKSRSARRDVAGSSDSSLREAPLTRARSRANEELSARGSTFSLVHRMNKAGLRIESAFPVERGKTLFANKRFGIATTGNMLEESIAVYQAMSLAQSHGGLIRQSGTVDYILDATRTDVRVFASTADDDRAHNDGIRRIPSIAQVFSETPANLTARYQAAQYKPGKAPSPTTYIVPLGWVQACVKADCVLDPSRWKSPSDASKVNAIATTPIASTSESAPLLRPRGRNTSSSSTPVTRPSSIPVAKPSSNPAQARLPDTREVFQVGATITRLVPTEMTVGPSPTHHGTVPRSISVNPPATSMDPPRYGISASTPKVWHADNLPLIPYLPLPRYGLPDSLHESTDVNVPVKARDVILAYARAYDWTARGASGTTFRSWCTRQAQAQIDTLEFVPRSLGQALTSSLASKYTVRLHGEWLADRCRGYAVIVKGRGKAGEALPSVVTSDFDRAHNFGHVTSDSRTDASTSSIPMDYKVSYEDETEGPVIGSSSDISRVEAPTAEDVGMDGAEPGVAESEGASSQRWPSDEVEDPGGGDREWNEPARPVRSGNASRKAASRSFASSDGLDMKLDHSEGDYFDTVADDVTREASAERSVCGAPAVDGGLISDCESGDYRERVSSPSRLKAVDGTTGASSLKQPPPSMLSFINEDELARPREPTTAPSRWESLFDSDLSEEQRARAIDAASRESEWLSHARSVHLSPGMRSSIEPHPLLPWTAASALYSLLVSLAHRAGSASTPKSATWAASVHAALVCAVHDIVGTRIAQALHRRSDVSAAGGLKGPLGDFEQVIHGIVQPIGSDAYIKRADIPIRLREPLDAERKDRLPTNAERKSIFILSVQHPIGSTVSPTEGSKDAWNMYYMDPRSKTYEGLRLSSVDERGPPLDSRDILNVISDPKPGWSYITKSHAIINGAYTDWKEMSPAMVPLPQASASRPDSVRLASLSPLVSTVAAIEWLWLRSAGTNAPDSRITAATATVVDSDASWSPSAEDISALADLEGQVAIRILWSCMRDSDG